MPLSAIFLREEFRDPDLFELKVTVTEVRASPDLQHMTAFVSGLGRDLSPAQLAGLKRIQPFLRSQVAKARAAAHGAGAAFPARHRARLRHAYQQGDAATRGPAGPGDACGTVQGRRRTVNQPNRHRHRSKKPKGRELDGWLIVDKPSGIGSTDVVNKVKRAFDAQKAGHGGTLDPLATGLLPVAFGAATKTVPYVMDGTKTYHFTLKFGEARDTDDADGQVVATSDVRPTDAEIEAVLPGFRGDIMQVPPAYSAIKIGGERAYDLAREGQVFEIAARPARIDRFDLISRPDADTAIFHVESGKGGLYAQPGAGRGPGRWARSAISQPCVACGSDPSGRNMRFPWTRCS
jgi:tRNA pseudouridine(55) synthase